MSRLRKLGQNPIQAEVSSIPGVSNAWPTCPFQTRVTLNTTVFLVSRAKPGEMAGLDKSLSSTIVPRKYYIDVISFDFDTRFPAIARIAANGRENQQC